MSSSENLVISYLFLIKIMKNFKEEKKNFDMFINDFLFLKDNYYSIMYFTLKDSNENNYQIEDIVTKFWIFLKMEDGIVSWMKDSKGKIKEINNKIKDMGF